MGNLNMIAGVGQQWQIGLKGNLPWKRPKDLDWFKRTTANGLMLVGERTYRTLPDNMKTAQYLSRTNRELRIWSEFTQNAHKPLLESLKNEERDTWIIGGAMLYRLFVPHVDRIYLSLVDYDGPADVYFPHDILTPRIIQRIVWHNP